MEVKDIGKVVGVDQAVEIVGVEKAEEVLEFVKVGDVVGIE